MFDSLEIIKETSHKDASLKLNELITQFIEKNKKFNMGLSGGNTPKFFYQTFAELNQENSDITSVSYTHLTLPTTVSV